MTSWTGGQKVDPRTRAYKRNAWNPKIPPNRDTSVLCSVERSLRRRVLAELGRLLTVAIRNVVAGCAGVEPTEVEQGRQNRTMWRRAE